MPIQYFLPNSARISLVSCFCMLVIACDEGGTYAPVTDINANEPIPKTGVHHVKQDETLYEIAWRYGLDYRDVAARNQLNAPYAVHSGQTIHLNTNKGMVLASNTKANPSSAKFAALPNAVPSQPSSETLAKHAYPHQIVWAWPADGKVVNVFSLSHKGINIAGYQGQVVRAAAAGKVVYSGSGLRGYGNLILIKHNSLYLSAYAHNQTLWVHEGDWVKQGQKIAEMGKTGTNKVILHFEIRRAGQPVDPLSLLSR